MKFGMLDVFLELQRMLSHENQYNPDQDGRLLVSVSFYSEFHWNPTVTVVLKAMPDILKQHLLQNKQPQHTSCTWGHIRT